MAYGPTTQRAYPDADQPSFGKEIAARVAGTVLDSEEGWDWHFQEAGMSLLTYIFP